MVSTQSPSPQPQEDGLKETIRTIVFAMIVALLIRTLAFEPFNIPSSSMVPTLLVGDYLFVSKYTYGYGSTGTFWGLAPFSGRTPGSEPHRGDVVVFKLPRDGSTDYIKRLIGLPGDTIQMRQGILYINSVPVERDKLASPVAAPEAPLPEGVTDYLEHLPDGPVHIIREEGDNRPLDNTDVFVVPPHHYFFMGDNRDNSQDSRTRNVGYVPEENLVGKARFLFFSLKEGTHFLGVLEMAVGRALAASLYEDRLMGVARKLADVSELTARLGHEFALPQLLQDALTHPSLAGFKQRKKSPMPYERLEFLGDRVLGLIIAEWLYEKFPESAEGDLAKRHAALVNREALRAVAVEIKLGQHLRLAHGEEAVASRKNLATLPDAMEALLGALYLDGGLTVAKAIIRRLWQKDIAIPEAPADPKTVLQEWAQGRKLPLPQYKVLEHSGPAHAPKFIIEVSVKGFDPVTAQGDSKRAAQKTAAQLLLQQVQKK